MKLEWDKQKILEKKLIKYADNMTEFTEEEMDFLISLVRGFGVWRQKVSSDILGIDPYVR